MISINNLTLDFGSFRLFKEVSFHVSGGERVGLVGRNGSGKSTLLKIITGSLSPSEGTVEFSSDISIGYLPQELNINFESSVMEAALEPFSHIEELEKTIERCTQEIAERKDYESESYLKLVSRLAELNERLALYASDNPEREVELVLTGLGFEREQFEMRRDQLSVGWNMRIELAKVLLANPDLLLLDEPTNHLDIESIEWLEEYLHRFRGSLVLISHDRRFLDSITNRTVEIVLGSIYDYKVSYSHFKKLREERIEQQRAAYENQQRMIAKQEQFIDRFRYQATKANQVQSRIKALERLERVEIDDDESSAMSVRFPDPPRSGDVAVKGEGLTMAYGAKKLFSNLTLTIKRGEKIALVGKNGEGKSTFLKILAEGLEPNSGELTLGHNVVMGYYAQNQEEHLNREETVFETIDNVAVGEVRTKIRDILGAFLFSGEEIEKKVAVLSGGERARLAMAKLMLKPYNLLVLDEPTNHMDIRSKEILKNALAHYPGTVLLVSHDRDFLTGLAERVYHFRGGRVREYSGGIEYFLESQRRERLAAEAARASGGAVGARGGGAGGVAAGQGKPGGATGLRGAGGVATAALTDDPGELYRLERSRERERQRRERRVERCEAEVAKFEERLEKLEKELSSGVEGVELEELLENYSSVKRELEGKMKEWEEAMEQLEDDQ